MTDQSPTNEMPEEIWVSRSARTLNNFSATKEGPDYLCCEKYTRASLPQSGAEKPVDMHWQPEGTFFVTIKDGQVVAYHSGDCNKIVQHHTCEGHLKTPSPDPVQTDGELDTVIKEDVERIIKEGDGFWHPCSGCHETVDGQHYAPYSTIFQTYLGMGCCECGGLGAVWDNTDYEDMAKFMQESALTPASGQPSDHIGDVNKMVPIHYTDGELSREIEEQPAAPDKSMMEEMAEALNTINNARHSDCAVGRFVPERTYQAIDDSQAVLSKYREGGQP